MAPFPIIINPHAVTDDGTSNGFGDTCDTENFSSILTLPTTTSPYQLQVQTQTSVNVSLRTTSFSVLQDAFRQVGAMITVANRPTNVFVSDVSYSIEQDAASAAMYIINIHGVVPFGLGTERWSPEEVRRIEMRSRIRTQLSSKFNTKHLNIVKENTPEDKARGLLREMIGDKAFLQYIKKGFITVRGRTGLMYKVSPTGVWSYAPRPDGKYDQFEYICIVFRQSGIPPTDAVIMRKLLIEHDEFGLRKAANVSKRNSASLFRQEAIAVAAG